MKNLLRTKIYLFLAVPLLSACALTEDPAPASETKSSKDSRAEIMAQISQIFLIRPHGAGYVIFIPTDEAFGLAKTKLTDETKKKVAKLAPYLVAITDLQVYGLTDNLGYKVINKRRSQQRADAIAGQLIKAGVPEKNFVRVEGLGDAVPMADNSTVQGRKTNRRIEIIFTAVKW